MRTEVTWVSDQGFHQKGDFYETAKRAAQEHVGGLLLLKKAS
jgi:hypothetical protein